MSDDDKSINVQLIIGSNVMNENDIEDFQSV